MDEVTWGALALTLTLLAGAWTWWAFRNRGAASGTRGLALTLLPAAAWLTGTLELATQVGQAVTRWATLLVFSPIVWLGVILGGLSMVLFVVAGMLPDRRGGRADRPKKRRGGKSLPSSGSPRQGPVVDDDLAEIEALLRKRGIE